MKAAVKATAIVRLDQDALLITSRLLNEEDSEYDLHDNIARSRGSDARTV